MSGHPPHSDNLLNEAPGIAWTTLYTKTGGKINLTIRALSGREALDELVETVVYAKEKYHFDVIPVYPETKVTDEPPAPKGNSNGKPIPVSQTKTTPANTGNADGETEVMTVEKFKKLVNDNGKTHLKVYGGKYMKFGVTAWPETVADLFDLDDYEIGKEYQWNTKARVLIVDGKAKKVLSFE